MLRRLYDWTLSLAARKSAEYWLAFIAFIESSIFLVPADVLFLPMALARPDRAYRYAIVATVASVLGGIAGWMLGHYAYETVAKPMLEFYGKLDEFEALTRRRPGNGFILLMLVTSGLAHLPPIKVVTILAGVISFPLAVHRVGDHRARRPLPVPGLAAAPLRRADQAFRRGTAGTACRGGGGRPHFALLGSSDTCIDRTDRRRQGRPALDRNA